MNCLIHEEETGEKVTAVGKFFVSWRKKKVPLCEECVKSIRESESAERANQAKYDYACGYGD